MDRLCPGWGEQFGFEFEFEFGFGFEIELTSAEGWVVQFEFEFGFEFEILEICADNECLEELFKQNIILVTFSHIYIYL